MRLSRLFPRAIYLFALSVLLASCAASRRAEAQRYDLKGKVLAVDRSKGEVTVEHEEVKGYNMAAMTMDFPLRDADALNTVAPGDGIQATLVVAEDASYWLENPAITKTLPGSAATPAAAGGPSEPRLGAEVPDVRLVNQDGRAISPRQFKGRSLAVTFIYTRCPMPDQCPLLSTNFAALNGALASDAELGKKAHLLSVTLDPEYDKPEVLRRYGSTYAGGKFDAWDFATGDPSDVRRFAEFFGLAYKAESGQVIHSLRTAVLTPEGRLYKLYRGNEWKPAEVLNDLKSASQQ